MGRRNLKLPIAEIIDQYVNGEQSSPQLAERYGVDPSHIRNLLKVNGTHIRSASEATNLARKTGRITAEMEQTSVEAMVKGYREKFGRGKAIPCPRWKGGRRRSHDYILIYKPDHPNARKDGYVFEHRLVMEQKLGRFIGRSEIPHHLNGIKDDNRPENLELLSLSNNRLREAICGDCPLRKEIRLVQFQNKQLLEQIRQLNLRFAGFIPLREEDRK